ncbi:hypothetical protein INR49_028101 [Caranx melampygus]|nr:hypothetical protein INR49_028101 [Caranx melampygus]
MNGLVDIVQIIAQIPVAMDTPCGTCRVAEAFLLPAEASPKLGPLRRRYVMKYERVDRLLIGDCVH